MAGEEAVPAAGRAPSSGRRRRGVLEAEAGAADVAATAWVAVAVAAVVDMEATAEADTSHIHGSNAAELALFIVYGVQRII